MKVSIIVATYRASEHLSQAVASALAQTWDNLEVIVSDDAGDPSVRELVEKFADPRVRYRKNGRRLGPAGNHRAAFSVAEGELLGILNHDDLWRPTFLDRLCPAFSDPDVAIAFCDHDIVDESGKVLVAESDSNTRRWHRHTLKAGRHQPFTHLAAKGTIPVAMASIFRRGLLPPDSEWIDAGGAYDLYLAYLLAASGGAAHYVDERLTAWRVHDVQLTRNPDEEWLSGTLACYQAMKRDPAFASCGRAVRRGLAAAEYAMARRKLRQKQPFSSASHALASLRSRPTAWRPAAVLVASALQVVVRSAIASGRAVLSS